MARVTRFVVMMGLLLAAWLTLHVQVVFFLFCLITLGFLAGGLLVFHPLKVDLPLVLQPLGPLPQAQASEPSAQQFVAPRLDKEELPMVSFPRRVTLFVGLRNLHILLATAVIVVFTIALSLSSGAAALKSTTPTESGLFEIEGLCLGSVFLLEFAWIWLGERRILRNAALTLGTRVNLSAVDSPFRQIQYSFQDGQGKYRGGYGIDFHEGWKDNVVLVLYDKSHPNRNKPGCGFLFHRVKLETRTNGDD